MGLSFPNAFMFSLLPTPQPSLSLNIHSTKSNSNSPTMSTCAEKSGLDLLCSALGIAG
jgi:hypothetical protein